MISFGSLLLLCWTWSLATAWTQLPQPTNSYMQKPRSTYSALFMSAAEDADNSSELSSSSSSTLERVRISGVSVSSKGFHVLVESTRGVVPLAVTSDPQDAYAATSPESLTILQLLSGVDMAGAILPPETLAKLVVYHCEFMPEVFCSATQRDVLEYVRKSLPADQSSSYAEAHPWVQSRVQLPQRVTLDQLTLTYSHNHWQCRLECALPADVVTTEVNRKLTVLATPEIVKPICYQYENDGTSILFTCLALALRYKAPIVLEHCEAIEHLHPNDLDQEFPQRTTVGKLQQQSTRVVQNIERGFEIHKLTKALQSAREFGDEKAVKRIRAELDRYDSMDELPTIEHPVDKSSSSLQSNASNDEDNLDDLDENILQ
jgi:hypothetical protein